MSLPFGFTGKNDNSVNITISRSAFIYCLFWKEIICINSNIFLLKNILIQKRNDSQNVKDFYCMYYLKSKCLDFCHKVYITEKLLTFFFLTSNFYTIYFTCLDVENYF